MELNIQQSFHLQLYKILEQVKTYPFLCDRKFLETFYTQMNQSQYIQKLITVSGTQFQMAHIHTSFISCTGFHINISTQSDGSLFYETLIFCPFLILSQTTQTAKLLQFVITSRGRLKQLILKASCEAIKILLLQTPLFFNFTLQYPIIYTLHLIQLFSKD